MADGQNARRQVLVSGATGNQGGAVARSLLARGFKVRALTRDPDKPAAKALAERGTEVVLGDLEDRASLDLALDGIHGVFSVQNYFEAGYEGEVRQGKQLADAAKEAGVSHFVYSSVGSAHRDTGIPQFESKWEVEEHVRGVSLPYTILRPVGFMQNWEWMRDQILSGTIAQPLDPDKPLQQVNVEDIGAFAAMSFEDPERWTSREVDLAGDELTMPRFAETFGRVTGREVSYFQVPWEQYREAMGEEFTAMNRWFNEVGYEADIGALRKEYPELSTLERYLRTHGWEGAATSG
jgi:uncharacterized protein YbjT (DUF2867 family)